MARTVIVTGSDSGIGRATAVVLAEQGYDVGITFHEDEEGAQETGVQVRAHGRRAEVRRMDLTEGPSAADVIDDLIEALGGLDVLVNNAGVQIDSPFLDHSAEDWQTVLDVNLTGPFLCGQRAARHMRDTGREGRIINVSSVHEHIPLPEAAAYCASKGGVGLLTKVMALELAPLGITVNAVAPGEVATPMTGQEGADPEEQDRPGIPLGRPGDPREIGHVIAHLASPEASYTTGASFVSDGGLMLMAAVRD